MRTRHCLCTLPRSLTESPPWKDSRMSLQLISKHPHRQLVRPLESESSSPLLPLRNPLLVRAPPCSVAKQRPQPPLLKQSLPLSKPSDWVSLQPLHPLILQPQLLLQSQPKWTTGVPAVHCPLTLEFSLVAVPLKPNRKRGWMTHRSSPSPCVQGQLLSTRMRSQQI